MLTQNEEKHLSYDLFNTSSIHINLAGVIGGYRRDGLAVAVLQGGVLCVCVVGGGVNLLFTAVVNEEKGAIHLLQLTLAAEQTNTHTYLMFLHV